MFKVVIFIISIYTLAHIVVAWFLARPWGKSWLWMGLGTALALIYPWARWLERHWLNDFSITLHWLGALWMGLFLYLFLGCLAGLILTLLWRIAAWIFPNRVPCVPLSIGKWRTVIILITAISIATMGYFNAQTPITHSQEIRLRAEAPGKNEVRMRVVAISDLHLSAFSTALHTQKIVHHIMELRPDLIVLLGDILDALAEPVAQNKSGLPLLQLHAPLGVFAILGNHEYIGGSKSAISYLEQFPNIKILRDTATVLDNDILLVGRDDYSSQRFESQPRVPLETIIAAVVKTPEGHSRPILLLDHQPVGLQEASQHHVALQISGHTHGGQLWPSEYIVRRVYDGLVRGLAERHGVPIYITPGVGTWGPPMRVGPPAEITCLDLIFPASSPAQP